MSERPNGLRAAAALLAASCAAAGALMPLGMISGPSLPGHLYCVEHENANGSGRCLLYRSQQPTPAQFVALRAQLGVDVVIKLNKPSLLADGPHDQVPAGVALWAHPWWPVGPVSHDELRDALADVDACVAQSRAAGGACLIHCTHGIDRTGLLVAVWRVAHGVPAAIAWAEWRAFPRAPEDALLYDAFQRETGFHIPEAER